MGKITVLSEPLSNKIAAGEVVERPASIVKELVENAIDAGSRRIFVSIQKGGIEGVKVVDDGEGMLRDDALMAFRRHATSKIVSEEDLSSIRTLGFRGEALPSIAAIAKLRLVTQTGESPEGTELRIEGGALQDVRAIGAPRGSSFEVSDLFFNVPARRKFLKTAQTELSHISRLLFDLALSHYRIHFRLSHGDRMLLDTPPCNSFKARLSQLFGEETLSNAMAVSEPSAAEQRPSLQAFISRPPLKKNFGKAQHLFVNGRSVKSPLLSHAVYEAYGSYLMKGEAPFFVLFLTIDPSEVDVNVHPAKREVRFRNTASVHQWVRNVLRETLSSAGDEIVTSASDEIATSPRRADSDQADRREDNRADRWALWPNEQDTNTAPNRVTEADVRYRSDRLTGLFPSALAASLGQDKQESDKTGGPPLIRPLGQVYGTFLLAEIDGVLAIVDQHTAHERILYEELLNAWQKTLVTQENGLEIQPFLIPQQVDLPIAKGALLKEHLETLGQIGCKIEVFGETTFLIRELPALLVGIHLEGFLDEVCDDLSELGVTGKTDQPIRTLIASMACHGAIRAHQPMSLPEIGALLRQYFERKTPVTCPHGRPIVQTYPLSDLEKLFRRK